MPLTPHQQYVGEQTISSIKAGNKRVILQGAAGVGKTYLSDQLVQICKRDHTINPRYNNGTIYVTAPTNKALSILQNKIQPSSSIVFKTIHSALGMKLVTDGKTGVRKFVPGWTQQERGKEFNKCKMCVIDEASMVNTQILGLLDELPFPILFIGDRFQINPVNELNTPVFNRNYPTFELTEIIRQGEGNPIIDLSRDIDLIFFKQPRLVDGKGYVYNNNLDSIIDHLAEINGTDELKYISWTNNDIDAMNDTVRKRIYGKPKRVELGEILVFNAPFGEHYTNKEVKVEQLDIITDYVPIPRQDTSFINDQPVKLDQIKMKFYRINNNFRVVHEDSDELFKIATKYLEDNCKKFNWNWKGKYFFVEQFADITYNHAITVHKSQGSTYKQVVLNIGNINFNKNAEEKQRLLYTGITRASDLVILNNVR